MDPQSGLQQLRRHASHANALPLEAVPHVTVIRPLKGLEPKLYDCLSSTFRQSYPPSKFTVYLCISSRSDRAYPIALKAIHDHAHFGGEIKLFIEEEDPYLHGEHGASRNLGPNPKIRNMSRAYRSAKGDIVWLVDCNVWVEKDAAALMVDRLCGFNGVSSAANGAKPQTGRKFKFVHQLPLAVDVSADIVNDGKREKEPSDIRRRIGVQTLTTSGSLLDEMFLSTSHAKFYTAISTVAVAPCIVGKSNMFRRSHLNALTIAASSPSTPDSPASADHIGLDFFSHNICEDHLIGDLLWRKPVPPEIKTNALREGHSAQTSDLSRPTSASNQSWGNHAIVINPPCIQPLAGISIGAYTARRTRWLRVRKFTVLLATLVEPGTESLLCSLHGAFGLTTLDWCHQILGIPQTWTAFWTIWMTSIGLWMLGDVWLWSLLNGWNADGRGPPFVGSAVKRRDWLEWVSTWISREALALPIWASAVFGGVEVQWRGKTFRVGMDARVKEVYRDNETKKMI
ncbi:hypothetical protein MMC25_006689 [Agyrium rufum]|nr:hypothetical protein [Agyrium rufum]